MTRFDPAGQDAWENMPPDDTRVLREGDRVVCRKGEGRVVRILTDMDGARMQEVPWCDLEVQNNAYIIDVRLDSGRIVWQHGDQVKEIET